MGSTMKPNISRGSRLEDGAEQQPQRRHAEAGQRHHGQDDQPVQIDVGLDAGGVDHRGDGQDDDGRDDPLGAAGEHLGDGDQPDRAGGLDPVLDLTGEAELLGQLHGHRLDALEHDGKPTTPGTRTVAKADSAPGPLAPPMPCPIFGKT